MRRLGYTRYVAQGGDVGAVVTDAMGRQAPEGLLGIHTNLLVTALANAGAPPAEPSEKERAALDALATFRTSDSGYFVEQATRPQTIGYALLDSPVALDARPRHRQLREDLPRLPRQAAGGPSHPGQHRRQHHAVLADGHRGLGGPAYWESGRAAALAAGQAPPEVSLPVGFTTFPGEIFRAPRSWVEQAYPNLTSFNEVDRGGHFAAWQEPQLFSEEVRAAFRSLR
jgi:hypothetical protein